MTKQIINDVLIKEDIQGDLLAWQPRDMIQLDLDWYHENIRWDLAFFKCLGMLSHEWVALDSW
jgi:hypothetical protein